MKALKPICFFNSGFAQWLEVDAITLFPFIFFATGREQAKAEHILAHEYIHVLQIKKIGFFSFYCSYWLQYFGFRLAGKDEWDAYLAVTHEAEAYGNQENTEVPATEMI